AIRLCTARFLGTFLPAVTTTLERQVARLRRRALAPAKNDPLALGKSDPRQERGWEQEDGRAISSTPQACGLPLHHPRRRRVLNVAVGFVATGPAKGFQACGAGSGSSLG